MGKIPYQRYARMKKVMDIERREKPQTLRAIDIELLTRSELIQVVKFLCDSVTIQQEDDHDPKGIAYADA